MRLAVVTTTLCTVLIATNVSASGDNTGTVRSINVNKNWGGISIELDGAPVFEAGSACASPWAFSPTSEELTKQFLAVAAAAKATGEPIRISTNGCVATPVAPAPQIQWIDYGIRTGS